MLNLICVRCGSIRVQTIITISEILLNEKELEIIVKEKLPLVAKEYGHSVEIDSILASGMHFTRRVTNTKL